MCAAPADPLERDALVWRFLDVVLDDEELLDAEFEAIVAGWRPAQPAVPSGGSLRRTPGTPRPADRTASGAIDGSGGGVSAQARERSPPAVHRSHPPLTSRVRNPAQP